MIVASAALTFGGLAARDVNSLVRAADSAAEAQHQTAGVLRPQVFYVVRVMDVRK